MPPAVVPRRSLNLKRVPAELTFHPGEPPLNEPNRAMLGSRGTVCETFQAGRGKVRIGDTVWLATGPDLAEGTPVAVSGVQGTRLVVAAIEP